MASMISSPPALHNGAALKPFECSLVKFAPRLSPSNFVQRKNAKLYGSASYKNRVSACAEYNGTSRESGVGDFLGGFLLGGVVFGALGYLFAPQISKSLWGEDHDGLRKKMPKILDDDDQCLETMRKTLNEKIAQLNSAIDDVSAQLRAENGANGSILGAREVESAV